MIKYFRSYTAITCLVVLSLLIAGFAYQFISTKFDQYNFPSQEKLIDVAGYKLHINCKGSGTPTIILDAGGDNSSLDWALVQPEIAKFTHVCSYDRAGMGWSEESPSTRTLEHMVDELNILLTNAHVPAPYILIGHSFGGGVIQLFAARYPDKVTGIILVDSVHGDEWHKDAIKTLFELGKPTWMTSFKRYFGITRFFSHVPQSTILPANIQHIDYTHRQSTKFLKTMNRVFSMHPTSMQQLKDGISKSENFKNIPMIVITAGKGLINVEMISQKDRPFVDEVNKAWKDLQNKLVARSSSAKQLIAEHSGHMIPHEQPAIIIDAIHEMVNRYKS